MAGSGDKQAKAELGRFEIDKVGVAFGPPAGCEVVTETAHCPPLGVRPDPGPDRYSAPYPAADTAADRWQQKDQGIWEIRGEPRDFLYSKLMCWVAVDRAIALAGHLGAEDRVADWEAARDEIRAVERRPRAGVPVSEP